MALQELVYISRATTPFSNKALEVLVAQARTNNADAKVTGLLLYANQCFFQLLEGEATTLARLYQRIERDNRHLNVTLLLNNNIAKRQCSHWDMALVNADNAEPTMRTQIQQHFDLLLQAVDNNIADVDIDVNVSRLLEIFLLPERYL